MRKVRVGIIGNARNIPVPADSRVFSAMCKKALGIISDQLQLSPSEVVLVSGGAAWGDHVAVSLYLRSITETPFSGLELHVPCAWIPLNHAYEDDGVADWRVNPGHLANGLQRVFGTAISRDTLSEIEAARNVGAVVIDSAKGFHARNSAIAAASDYLIAFTSDDVEPISGGTADTWNKFNRGSGRRFHINIPSLIRQMME